MKIRTEQVVDVQEWDALVSETYGKVYSFQQQNGCKSRGVEYLTVPSDDYDDDMHEEIPEIVNGPEMGVKFAKWLERDPKQPLKDDDDVEGRGDQWVIDLWWKRNFYPCLGTVANDLHKRGLLEAGEYIINIDW